MAWLQERANGRWRGMYQDANGKPQVAKGPNGEASSKSKREAKRWAEDEEAKIRAGVWNDPAKGKTSFADYYAEWKRNRIAEVNTQITYDAHYNAEFRKAFGHVEVAKISSRMIQTWVTDMIERGTTPGTVHARLKHLSVILGGQKGSSAIRDGLIRDNPCHGVQLPKVDQREVDVYSVEESDLVLSKIATWWRPIPLLATETAFRWGELMGLRVSDFADDYSSVYKTSTIVEVSRERTGNGTVFMWKPRPKGGKRQRVALSDEAATLVAEVVRSRQLFPMDRLFSMPEGKRRYVNEFDHNHLPRREDPWEDGWPISRSFFRDRIWLPAHEASGVRPRRFHDLKGSHLTWLLAGGADPLTVQARGDHANFKTTQVYLTAMADADRRALEALKVTRDRGRGLSGLDNKQEGAQ